MFWTNPLQAKCVLHPQALKSGGFIWSDPTGNHPSLSVSKDEHAAMVLEGFLSYLQGTSYAEATKLITQMAGAACIPTPRVERRTKPRPVAGLLLAQEDEQ